MPQTQTPVEAQTEASTETSLGCVLIVDDLPANVRLLSGILKVAGYDVLRAPGGPEALTLLEETSPLPDVVLLDVMMPELDGFEVCRRIRARPATAHLPVVMVTALQDSADRVNALEAGADDFLTKPVDDVEVVARVKSLVRLKRQREELETAYADLRRVEEMREGLTAMLVHDLRTPLTSILGPLDLLRHGELDAQPEMRREVIEMCSRSAQRLLDMVNQLLDVSKLESGQMKLDCTPINIDTLLDDAMRQVASLARDARIEIKREIAPDLPPLLADEDVLRRVLINLVGNALKFTGRDGTITIHATCATNLEAVLGPDWSGSGLPSVAEAIFFQVQDTGDGIAPEDQARIFDKFGQVESRRSARKLSTGLGLTFCKLAVEAHGGGIWVQSTPGAGSVFSFALPLRP